MYKLTTLLLYLSLFDYASLLTVIYKMINYSRPVPSRLVWDTSVSNKRAWRKFWAIFQDEAIAYSRNHTVDGHGLHHLLLTEIEFQTEQNIE